MDKGFCMREPQPIHRMGDGPGCKEWCNEKGDILFIADYIKDKKKFDCMNCVWWMAVGES